MHTFSILSLFPEIVAQGLSHSIIGRAIERNLLHLNYVQIRDFALNEYGQVDDKYFGGGRGMLLMIEPILKAWLSLYIENPEDFLKNLPAELSLAEWQKVISNISQDPIIYLSPKGKIFNQKMAEEMVKTEHIVFLCGHYEGIDQRVLDLLNVQEISLGDFVLTGGEPAAVVMIDAISRLIPGVLPDPEAHQDDSHSCGYLEEPQYTRPADWRGLKVPEILLSGHQAKIDAYRQNQRIWETLKKRPDLMHDKTFSQNEWLSFIQFLKSYSE